MASQSFELISTTADIGFIARANELKELFAQAAAALFSIITDPQQVSPQQAIHIQAQGSDWPELVVNWLSEILYQQEISGMLFTRAEIKQIQPYCLDSYLWGEPYDSTRHDIIREVKAITYHKLSLGQNAQGQWRLQVIVDI